MSFQIAPDPGDRGEPDVKQGRVGGEASAGARRLVTDGVEVLARGALVCPSCALPISPAPRIRPRAVLRCGFCDHTADALEFLRRGAADAPGNRVELVARLG